MTQIDIIRMAREADLIDDSYASDWYVYQLQRFAALVETAATEAANARATSSWSLMCKKLVAAEREATAKFFDGKVGQADLRDIAAAIRARGQA
jgi:hypothetical protein